MTTDRDRRGSPFRITNETTVSTYFSNDTARLEIAETQHESLCLYSWKWNMGERDESFRADDK